MSYIELLFSSAKSVTVLGKEFRSGGIVCVNPPSNLESPTFGEIVRIFVHDDAKKLLIRLYDTETYSSHYNAYQVVKTHLFSVIPVNKLGIHEVYHKYFLSPNIFIVVKSYHHIEYDI